MKPQARSRFRARWVIFVALVVIPFDNLPAVEAVPTIAQPLASVAEPPPVQFFMPGFAVRRLPVELTNINNVLYRLDGTLVALGYDGRVWLLRDTDGDGLEDEASEFWGNPKGLRAAIGMDLTPPGYEHGNGLFIASKTACLLVVDTDGDERADREIEVAGGWQESFHNVDGLGVAFDRRDGGVYYGRGTYNFTDPLLRDEQGVAKYSLTDESAAIIRVSPDFTKRSIVATGIRFPVAMRFNRHGDLFATDQEGATWVPNGNPLDELLHIQEGRHYGFPARHPKFLPDVIDEPSTFDYGPQHQSTCGLNFNEPVGPDGPIFGPERWRGDALVAGYARGKLYRTQLVKSAVGYVARTQLLATLNMLAVDACVGSNGELVIACHSGGPDWGSGPTGQGTLYKVTYIDRDAPQPVVVWPAGSQELRVEFDRPMDPLALRDVLAKAKLTAGQFVRAGDRFESLWPGYANVEMQKQSPRFDVPIHSAQLTPDGRTLVLNTDPIAAGVHYALELPTWSDGAVTAGELPQHPAVDLDFDLSGWAATWTPADGGASWEGWLPHLDLEVSRRFTAGSASHDVLWEAMKRPGELTFRGKLDLADMLRPAVQPGSTLDFEYPPESVTVRLETQSPSRVELLEPSESSEAQRTDTRGQLVLAADAVKTVDVAVRLTSSGGSPPLTVSWTTNEDDRPRPLPLHRQRVPWAETGGSMFAADQKRTIPELAGGDWERGRLVYFSADAACSKCHMIHRRGGQIGPDLSNLMHRDYASVHRDIAQPSFALNPDHLTYLVILEDGRTLSGVVRSNGDKIVVGDPRGETTEVDRDAVEELTPSPISTMPDDLPKLLGPERMRDLMTFLLTPPPADYEWPAEEPAVEP